jgi:hypothetical protein
VNPGTPLHAAVVDLLDHGWIIAPPDVAKAVLHHVPSAKVTAVYRAVRAWRVSIEPRVNAERSTS